MTKNSFRNLLRAPDAFIEIPIIQRDFAQGRQNPDVRKIRRSFLEALKQALVSGEGISLDFVYGNDNSGRFIPLDGQQRLTSLYLLHWYLAVRGGISEHDREFLKRFSYHTRFSSRDFCARLAATTPALDTMSIAAWLKDQHWFAVSWRKDPTVQSMLVVLDDIQSLFKDLSAEECQALWLQLTSETDPSITFEILPLTQMGLTDELYVKMNSRGKPLTDFEHFKAQFEQILKDFEAGLPEVPSQKSRYSEFAHKIDQSWADLVWPLRGTNDNSDDKFRLFKFLTDLVIWRGDFPTLPADGDLEDIAKSVYGNSDSQVARAAQDYLFSALDGLHEAFSGATTGADISSWFERLFSENSHREDVVTIFDSVNLLDDCCTNYGINIGRNRAFSLPRTLLLHAVIEYVVSKPTLSAEDISTRLRALRNVFFASQNEIRVEIFKALLEEVSAYVKSGDLGSLKSFNRAQIDEELTKSSLLATQNNSDLARALFRLEDPELLRGNLVMFDLAADATKFTNRARAFEALFSGKASYDQISAALLACGDYSQRFNDNRFQFGSPSLASVWRDLFSNRSRTGVAQTSKTLMTLLDKIALDKVSDVGAALESVRERYLQEAVASKNYDWRYYMTKYPAMRSGKSGIFISSSYKMGFDLCMMEQTRLSSYYTDPYVRAALQASKIAWEEHFKVWHYGWGGYEPDARWTTYLSNSRNFMRVTEEGFQLKSGRKAKYQAVLNEHGVDGEGMLTVRQSAVGGEFVDKRDRIALAAKVIKGIVEAGD
jgi:hypothetical protein